MNFLSIFFLLTTILVLPTKVFAYDLGEQSEQRCRNHMLEDSTLGEEDLRVYVVSDTVYQVRCGMNFLKAGIATCFCLGIGSVISAKFLAENFGDSLSAIIAGVGGPFVIVLPICGLGVWSIYKALLYKNNIEFIEEMDDSIIDVQ